MKIEKPGAVNKIKTWFINLKGLHQRIMARFLRKRNWVVFYLEEEHRECNDVCWLKLYRAELARGKN
jgi:hypothetical protein